MRRLSFFDNPISRVTFPMWRGRLVLVVFGLAFLVLLARAVYLQGINREFLQEQGVKRYERTVPLSATRGKITDRQGVVLAASVPARAVWAIPEDTDKATPEQMDALAKLIDIPVDRLRKRLEDHSRTFVYLRRQLPLDVAEQVAKLNVPGVHQLPETLRFYPEGEVTGAVVGFTNLDDKGQEGIELTYDDQLSGKPGSRRVIKDRLGRVVEDIRAVSLPVNGQDIELSIDTRMQYLVYRALADSVALNKAKSASAVVVDVKTGEILALANYPTFDPNDRSTFKGFALRNRVLTDTFEPGSTLKPFTMGLALDLGRITLDTQFNTGNGQITFHGERITDVSRQRSLDPMGIMTKSSNIGMALISERIKNKEMWTKFTELGFGQAPDIGFPGAAAGRLRPWERWRPIEKATMAYGYGLSTSLLQLARAYTAFARNGDMVSLTLIKRHNNPATVPVYPPSVASEIRKMLEESTGPEGAKLAQVQGYRVAGKSGTARKWVNGEYSKKYYRSSFVGFGPVSDPRIVVALTIDEPSGEHYYGGRVAAPVFAEIMGRTLRMMGVEPDAPVESDVVAITTSGSAEVRR
ncbi:MAG: penicillin-binding protein 2 [Burkholderiaceae bacterium]|nr:penicillin-binding protein 2 [Burkholderiaceae bacterium]MCD8515849.1 penicillin-binding protein 2 [Burkholderiaceae bacterium]MCD8536955.1 penicillin-binding protein 2 [Burkholderiaceae bacterium]MCD8565736.1 penicillin-binding protein 2 [Burkholderiaceae bacterium]